MAKKKYKKKPEVFYAIQYDGTNSAEMIAFCSQCSVVDGKLLFGPGMTVDPTSWIMSDNANVFTMMTNEQFVVYFELSLP